MSYFMFSIVCKRPEEDVHTYVSVMWLHITLRVNMHSRLRRRPFIALALVVMSTYSPSCEIQLLKHFDIRQFRSNPKFILKTVVIIGEYDCSESNKSSIC